MARKRPAKAHRSERRSTAREQVVQPDYYQKFRCIGPDCEDSCCVGWRVHVDRAAWQRYRDCQSDTLRPMFQEFVQTDPIADSRSPATYATMKLLPNGQCAFLGTDMLCAIQKELGAEALCNTCAIYPRVANRFRQQREYGLSVSCPEAARVALLHSEPTTLVMADADADLSRRGITTLDVQCKAEHVEVLNLLRVMIVRILQWREVRLGARMMLLGSLLKEVSPAQGDTRFRNPAEVMTAIETYSALFADPGYVEVEFAQLSGNLPRKLQCTTGFLADFLTGATPRFKECLTAFADGLLGGQADNPAASMSALMARYESIYDDHYLPYFREKGHVLENYLVNEVLANQFPFVRSTVLELYRVMVFNLAIIQIMLVGMAGYYKGLTDERVIQFIQSFARRSTHNDSYIGKLTEAITSKESPSFAEVMWMLKER